MVLSSAFTAKVRATGDLTLLINICINSLNSSTYGISVVGPGTDIGISVGPRAGDCIARASEARDTRPKSAKPRAKCFTVVFP